MKLPFRVILTAAMASATLVACSGNTKKSPPPPPVAEAPPTTTAPATSSHYTVDSLDTDSCLRQRIIYFDLDKTDIHSEFDAAIACHAAYLRQFPGARVTLEGNADERGTREYNLGLGERRGNAVSSALGAD
ncbi:MAG: OmpA family protein, partial [Pseudolabrys sp.]